MERQEPSTEIFEKFTWKIENFSRLNADKIYSEPFILCGYPWIRLFPKGNKNKDVVDHLSIYLEAMQTANMSEGWNRDVKFKLIVFNQIDTNGTITQECQQDYDAKGVSWGVPSFMSLTELCNPEKGFIVKDACIVGAEVFVSNSNLEKQVNQAVNLTVLPVSVEATKQVDAELGYTALGRVILLLQTSKVKDMNEQACKELQVLWDQVQKFKFDLTWLEPQVQSALGMKRYVEKALQVEKLKENMVVSVLETERLKAKLFAAELSLKVERDLLKAEGIKERDLDSELGSWSWRP
ncbi:MATH domain and coiled-coil domain-containing protein At3g58360-like [Trifolium pratense]|uniref:MATH domain and coiled-coil domain-containing protein At3g58360-like n=1 Tax=Trifolium pratense TaxID=57577 RepID=UPI001E696A53|nr:MATH domain and coiled-coil domain-containing protein At3g58360-like [Trifolium pratense]